MPTTTTDAALADHIDTHIADLTAEHGELPGSLEALVRASLACGWHAANAETAERLRDLVTEARVEVAKRMPFPILSRLDAIVTELEDRMGQ